MVQDRPFKVWMDVVNGALGRRELTLEQARARVDNRTGWKIVGEWLDWDVRVGSLACLDGDLGGLRMERTEWGLFCKLTVSSSICTLVRSFRPNRVCQ